VRPMTELMVRQPTVAQTTIPAELAADAPTVVTAMPCAYCRAAIPADSFVYWSPAKRLLSASCPDCHRRMTVAAPMWRRWSAVGSGGLGTSALLRSRTPTATRFRCGHQLAQPEPVASR